MLDQILKLHRKSELKGILKYLMNPTRVATGLKIDLELLIHLKEAYEEVNKTAEALSLAVTEDFLPVICRMKASPSDFVRGAEILYAREHKSVWYHEANAKAKSMVLELLRGLSAELQAEISIMLLVIAKALFAHAGYVKSEKKC
ncbi:hypothetical protein L1987_32376 [Smallanthus sonchifolius]|uniref:Uncharacterized protein n=1 Tax=Smallanthus sonchifolius TaxID=185202 RepID=A0ACB9HMG6_9ASTR|nr:hypothetical protein L1987_32376 [Smallanthus sonchifolius]